MRTEIFTYFTQIGGSRLLYSAESWVRVQLELETAGPVSVGTREDLSPVLSGKGILLTTGEEEVWVMNKGSRLFVTSETINRVKFVVEPVPWLATVVQTIETGFGGVTALIKKVASRKKAPAVASPQIPCPPGLYPRR